MTTEEELGLTAEAEIVRLNEVAETLRDIAADLERDAKHSTKHCAEFDYIATKIARIAGKCDVLRETFEEDASYIPDVINFGSPENVSRFFMERLRHETQEHFCVAYTNVKNRLIGWKEISIGGLNAAPADVKEAMKWAIRFKAYGLILVHNHPSGYPEPSKEDIELTKNFAEAAKFVDCEVLDHVIIGDGFYTSLRERGNI